jgi:hypothetical protein
MFPLYELLSHAELTKPRRVAPQVVEARRSARHARCGRLTLFPCVERPEPIDLLEEEPRVVAAISNVSTEGVGILHDEELPQGLQFEVDWESGDERIPLRFEVVHSQQTSAGTYRTGAKLVFGEMPPESLPSALPALPEPMVEGAEPVAQPMMRLVRDDEPANATEGTEDIAPAETTTVPGILKFEPAETSAPTAETNAPPGTFSVSAAFGFDKTERLDGATTCGWERSVEIRRAGDRLWIYIHSPGKKNRWGIFVDAAQFEAAFGRVQESAKSPFITTLAA